MSEYQIAVIPGDVGFPAVPDEISLRGLRLATISYFRRSRLRPV